jgi:ketosteroid isomerase-like protein
MRTFLIIATLCIFALPGAAASADESAILDAEKGWASAVLARDFAKLDTILTPGLIYAHSTGIIDDKSQYLSKMRSGTQKYAGIEHTSTTVRVYGNSAVAHSRARMHGVNASGPFDDKLMMIHMWVKSNGKWQLAAHQTTKLQ